MLALPELRLDAAHPVKDVFPSGGDKAVVLGERDKQRVSRTDFSKEIMGFRWDGAIVLAVDRLSCNRAGGS